MTDTTEDTARQIAEQGREALLERLRPAFAEAAAAHSDVLTLDDQQLELMVQRAADRADGLQWRRALASVASEQLGIGLGEALGHPAVARAQAIVGAPSYEEALQAVAAARAPEASLTDEPEDEAASVAESEGEVETEAVEESETEAVEESETEAVEESEAEAVEELETEAALSPMPENGGETVKLNAVHVGGLAGLPKGATDLELRFSATGFGIVRGTKPLGRIGWSDITAVEIPTPNSRRRRRRKSDGTIVIRSAQGSATFEIPGVTPEELGEHLGPLLREH
jgi:hypothetical protein